MARLGVGRPGCRSGWRAQRPALLIAYLILAGAPAAATTAARCESAVARATVACLNAVGRASRDCYAHFGGACAADAPPLRRALDGLRATISRECPDGATVAAAGYGGSLTPAGLVARAAEACIGEPASLAARSFGGPQAAVLAAADASGRACLLSAQREAVRFVVRAARARARCLAQARRGRVCDAARLPSIVDAARQRAAAAIAAACANLEAAVGLDVDRFLARADAQARCLTATTHGDATGLGLDCGPRAAVTVPPRGAWTEITLPLAEWGTQCGDGSPYRFYIRLAPAGQPLDRVLLDLQAGGVCLFESDCAGVRDTQPDLLRADADDLQPLAGIEHDDPGANPFADWTRVVFPYCTQDLHAGDGVAQVFPSLTVQRYGARNLRTALAYLRDVLWTALADADGYRPDRLRVVLAGESAGAWGVRFNYHHVLDDLRWIHTTAVPDGSLALDNGQPVGVRSLGLVMQLAWGARRTLPPYCLGTDCGLGLVLLAATAPRLLATPEQQLLFTSSQVDPIQRGTNVFPSQAAWTNACRAEYCAARGTPGVHYWLTADAAPFHTVLRDFERFNTLTTGGSTVADWLAAAVADPAGIADRVDEGTLTTDLPGVQPLACLP
ncbi:MAG: pectin acetylesterase-family hydrolase [Deltaproteobacteria bacterium]|nr:pectin acetylesterase-family hydrolase [Deltaproteobacteria bacterium]